MYGPLLLLVTLASACYAEKTCSKAGIILDDVPNRFIVCAERNGSLQAVVNECSVGLEFDVGLKVCTAQRIPKVLLRSFAVRSRSLSPSLRLRNETTGNSSIPRTSVPRSPLKECKGPGAFCSNCNTLSFCTASYPNGLRLLNRILDVPCSPGQVCQTGSGCVNVYGGGLCREGPFQCGDVGLYPDPYDCTAYHTCVGNSFGSLIDIVAHCEGGLLGNRWDPITSSCGWPEEVESCKKSPIPTCTSNLQMGSAGGPVYYICIADEVTHTISPRLFRCPAYLEFDEKAYACVPPKTA